MELRLRTGRTFFDLVESSSMELILRPCAHGTTRKTAAPVRPRALRHTGRTTRARNNLRTRFVRRDASLLAARERAGEGPLRGAHIEVGSRPVHGGASRRGNVR